MSPSRRDFIRQCAIVSVAAVSAGGSESPPPNPPGVRTHRLGTLRLDVINIGDIALALAPSMRAPADASEPEKQAVNEALAGQSIMPMQDVLVRGPGFALMVDTGAYDIAREEPYYLEGYTPPPPLAERLAGLGIDPGEVSHVVFTHRHFDHINGAVVKDADGRSRPLFPNAKHYIQKADWEYALARIGDLNTRIGRTFSVLEPAGLVEVIDGDRQLLPGISLLAAAGETPGHQVVRVESERQTAYVVGDMIHHPVEVAVPGFMVSWADEVSNRASRRRIHEAAADEHALAIASHIPETGRLESIGGRPAWTTA